MTRTDDWRTRSRLGTAATTGLPAGRLLGVPLRVSSAWIAVIALVTALYPGIVARLVPGLPVPVEYLISFVLGWVLLGSLLVHETGHVLACRLARVVVRAVVLSLPGGSVEHDRAYTPRQVAIAAVGGPAASLVLAIATGALAVLSGGVPGVLFGTTTAVNLAVTVFTLLPGLPMDGGELVRAAVWQWSGSPATGRKVARVAGQVVAIAVALGPLLLVRSDDLVGSGVVVAAGLLVAGYVWQPGPAKAVKDEAVTGAAIRTWLVVGAVSVAAVLVLRAYVVQSLVVASGSMDDTLRTGDHIVVDKLSYLIGGVRLGDVVVLDRPPGVASEEDELVKRVIGLAGDRIEARDGRVLRNGVPIDEPYLRPGCADNAAGLKPVTVASGQVYLLGDNRCHSLDSRGFGPVDESLVEGRAVAIIWPVDHAGSI
ncbi:signal peptidase I [Labedaea rhizosphaerae]|uniref:Signal peptidase I n=1 Tax=Labedaea rhizosphaerae TaxID=598644 RepID=A0A4V3D098_LABRH|nr:signal peptidase I [Labedaea rhizosphaerae]TDQ04905.1 signal peptidase I [Labedaea rhizosphaerae]